MLNVKYYYKIFYMAMPSNIYYWWNFGSLLGVVLMSQIISGVFLSLFYENDIILAFDSISQISRNINFGWFIRSIHANGASMFFIFIYLHMGRSLYFKLFIVNKKTWVSGVMILLLLFMSAFIGYVLPWGQMSFWGATVITNLLSSMPYFGGSLTLWVWGGFSVSKPTLLRFFSFHFILPFILLLMVIIHIVLLHEKGSSNPIGINSNLDKISFNPFFIWKDLMGVVIFLMIFIMVSLIFPYIFMDPDNFIPANPLVTPAHIQPEWYFLFAYAILRTISNKLGGVLALFMSILMYFLILFYNEKKYNYLNQKFVFKMFFFFWICNFFYLTILGAQLIEPPYEFLSKICSMIYFLLFMLYI